MCAQSRVHGKGIGAMTPKPLELSSMEIMTVRQAVEAFKEECQESAGRSMMSDDGLDRVISRCDSILRKVEEAEQP